MRHCLDVAGRLSVARRQNAVVVGGSLAGMLAARVLSDHFDDVTVLERDYFPEAPAPRKGLPQGRHAHALLDRGRRVLERFLPGLTEELVQAGAEVLDMTRDVAKMAPCGWFVQFPGDLPLLASSRDLIDWGVRRRVREVPNVRIRQGMDVTGLIRGPGGGSVAGVRIRTRPSGVGADRGGAELFADLVVVADGRNSRLPEWLAELGYEPPPVTVVDSFQGYASRLYRPPAGFEADWKVMYIQQAPPDDPRGGLISTVEGGLWIVSLVGGDGHYPPADEAGFLAFARSLRSPALYEAIAGAEPLSPIVAHRATENRLRHYDRLARFPDGVVGLGDAVSAFNPVYGQGMTVAVLGAEVLDRWLRGESSHRGPGRSRVFQRDLAREVATPWLLSTGSDYGFLTTEGPPRGRIARLTGRYFAEVMRSATRRPWVRRRFEEVVHLVRPLSALFGPGVLARLAWDRIAGEAGAGGRRVGPFREGPEAGSRPMRWPAVDLELHSAAGG